MFKVELSVDIACEWNLHHSTSKVTVGLTNKVPTSGISLNILQTSYRNNKFSQENQPKKCVKNFV